MADVRNSPSDEDFKFFEGLPDVGDTSEPVENFGDLPGIEPTFMERATAFGQAATGAIAENAPIAAGTFMGGSVGSLLGPPGLIGGAVAGFEAGRRAGKGLETLASETPSPTDPNVMLAVPSSDVLPPRLRSSGVAGEIFGETANLATLPLGAARLGLSVANNLPGRFINRVIDTARRGPGMFSAIEGAATTGTAALAGAAEEAFPGNVPARVTGEVVGGFFNPIRSILTATKGAAFIFNRAVSGFGQAARESQAGKVLRDIVEESGGDAEVLAELLESVDTGVALTAGQATGDPGLNAVEAMLRKNSASFDKESRDRAEAGLKFMQNAVRALESTGDPQALKAAGEMKDKLFRSVMNARVQAVVDKATEAARRLQVDTPAGRAELSRVAQEAVQSALREARDVETELWELIPQNIPLEASNIIRQADAISATRLPNETLPGPLEGFIQILKGEGAAGLPDDVQKLIRETFGDTPNIGAPGAPPTTSGKLLRFRTRALQLARSAAADPTRADDARIFGELAEAALDDLEAIGARGGGELDTARQFSKELNDTFTRTFANQARATTRTGAPRTPPEVFVSRAMATGSDLARVRMEEIRNATKFLQNRGIDSPMSQENIDTVFDSQERILRLAASEAIDPNTGRLNATRLGKFLRDNEGLLDDFPEVKNEINATLTTETAQQAAQDLATSATRAVEQKAAFSKLIKFENPVDAIGAAINSRNPVQEMLALTRFSSKAGLREQEGMRAAVLDFAISEATQRSGKMNFTELERVLFEPIRTGQPSLSEIMQRSRVFKKQDIDRLKKLINKAGDIEDAIGQGASLDQLLENPDGLTDLVLRMAGSGLGAKGAIAAGSPQTLIAASAGSRFLRNQFNKIPQGKINNVLIEAAKDPRFTAMLLRNASSNAERQRFGRQMNAFLVNAGLTALPGEEEDFDLGGQFSPGTTADSPAESSERLPPPVQ